MKTCSRCREVKAPEEFHRNRLRSDGRRGTCRACVKTSEVPHIEAKRARARELYAERGRAAHRLRVYGLTPEGFLDLLERQGHACAVCSTSIGDESALVDHDHASGVIRGLLCRPCNSGIGHLRDDPDLVRAALEYLTREV